RLAARDRIAWRRRVTRNTATDLPRWTARSAGETPLLNLPRIRHWTQREVTAKQLRPGLILFVGGSKLEIGTSEVARLLGCRCIPMAVPSRGRTRSGQWPTTPAAFDPVPHGFRFSARHRPRSSRPSRSNENSLSKSAALAQNCLQV